MCPGRSLCEPTSTWPTSTWPALKTYMRASWRTIALSEVNWKVREGKESAGAFNYYTAQAMCLQCHFQKPTSRRGQELPRSFTILAHESGTHLYFEFPTPTHTYKHCHWCEWTGIQRKTSKKPTLWKSNLERTSKPGNRWQEGKEGWCEGEVYIINTSQLRRLCDFWEPMFNEHP